MRPLSCKNLFAVSQALLAPLTALPFKVTAALVCLFTVMALSDVNNVAPTTTLFEALSLDSAGNEL